MKRPLRYMVNDKLVEKEINYIPVRYIIAVLITVLEVLAVIGIVVALCYIDNDLCTDLENAALRGVDVRIIVPHIPDKS